MPRTRYPAVLVAALLVLVGCKPLDTAEPAASGSADFSQVRQQLDGLTVAE